MHAPTPSPALFIVVGGLALVGCQPADESKGGDTGTREAPGEFDPGRPTVPDIDLDGLPDIEGPGLGDVVTRPAEAEVCYLGPARDGAVCLATVEWDPDWGSAYDYPPPYGGDLQYAEPVRFLDLNAHDPDLAIAPNFVLSEFMSAAKGRFGLFQSPVVDHMQVIRDDIGGPLRVNSGYRNVDYNAGVGGATYSRHMYGDAVDMASDAASLSELAELCAALGADYVDVYASHVHCDWRDSPLDPAFYPEDEIALVPADDHIIIDIPDGPEGPRSPGWQLEDAGGHPLRRGQGTTVPRLPSAVRVVVTTGPLRPGQIFTLPSAAGATRSDPVSPR